MLKRKPLPVLIRHVNKRGTSYGPARLASQFLRAGGYDEAYAVLEVHGSYVFVGTDGPDRYIITTQGIKTAFHGVDCRLSFDDIIDRLEREMTVINEREDAATR